MPTHALLGATGNTGSAILRSLLFSSPQNLTLNLYIRNEQKLLLLFPNLLHQTDITINLFTTPSSLPACLRDAEIIYNCIAPSTISRSNNLETHFAAQLISSLPPSTSPTPTVLWNRSIGLNPQIRNPVPPFFEVILRWAVDWAFDDMRSAQKLYKQAAAEKKLRLVCVDAPKLFDPAGKERCGFELVMGREKGEGRVRTGLYYGDLGEGFVEIGRRIGEGEWKEERVQAVGVGSKEKVRVNLFVVVGSVVWLLVRGVMGRVLGV